MFKNKQKQEYTLFHLIVCWQLLVNTIGNTLFYLS